MPNKCKGLAFYYNFIILSLQTKDTWQHITPCDILLVRHDNDCGYTFQNKAYAQIIDSLGELCTKRGLVNGSVATPYSMIVGNRAFHSPVLYNKSLSIISICGKVIQLIRGHRKGTEWIESHHVNLWCKILEISSPKCVIGIQPDEFLCRAGKIKNIPVFDLQHGTIVDDHPWYGETYRINTSIQDLPDGFLCWDDQSAATISKWAKKKGIRIIKIGNPWFLRFLKISPDDQLANEAVATYKITDENRPCILVTLEDGFAARWYPDKTFKGVMFEALEKVILDTVELYNWVIRLHPIQMRGKERGMILNYLRMTFGTEKVQKWLLASEIPLPILLCKTDLHITGSSTVVIECALMGIRSGMLNQTLIDGGKNQSYYSYERNIGMAEVIPQNPEKIKQWIVESLAKGRGQSTLEDTRQNLDTFIDEIAGRAS